MVSSIHNSRMVVKAGAKMKIIQSYNNSTKKAIRLISFAHFQDNCSPLFKDIKILKRIDIILQSNILFTHYSINGNTPDIFKDYFIFNEVDHQYDTVNNLNSVYSIPNSSLQLLNFKTNAGKLSINYICFFTWNYTLKDLPNKHKNVQPRSFLDELNGFKNF